MLITVDEYQEMLGLADVNEEKAESALEAAENLIEKYLRRRIAVQERTETTYFDMPCDRMQLKGYPVQEVGSLTGAEMKHLDAENGILRFARPVTGAVSCTYTGGMGTAPAAILQACALLAQAIEQSADNGGQTVMSERLDDYQVMFYNATEGRETKLEGFCPAAAALLNPYRGINR